jgi:glycosyltransferase involved in cell wall biosynthesis
MARLLLADRVKRRHDSFLAPLIPALERAHEVRFVSLGPGDALAEAIAWADIVWLEWCWDHAVWVTRSNLLQGRKCIVRLHSIEALQTDFPTQMDWSQVHRLVTVGDDIAGLTRERFPATAGTTMRIIPNGVDLARFAASERLDCFRVGWVGHVEPKKNPMLLLQIAHRLHQMIQATAST